MGLTIKQVERATEPGRYGDGRGLYLEVRSPENRQWVFRYERVVRDDRDEPVRKPNGRAKSKERWVCLGPAHTFDLDDARERARVLRKVLTEGKDPAEERAAKHAVRVAERQAAGLQAARALTFKEAAKLFYASKAPQWRNKKHSAQFLSSLEQYA